jgi:hypothetical protein
MRFRHSVMSICMRNGVTLVQQRRVLNEAARHPAEATAKYRYLKMMGGQSRRVADSAHRRRRCANKN